MHVDLYDVISFHWMNSTYFCRRCQVDVILDFKLQNARSRSTTLTLILENLFNEAYMEWDIRYSVFKRRVTGYVFTLKWRSHVYLLKMPTSNNKMYGLMGVLRYPNCNESSHVEFHSVLMSELQPEYLLYGPHNWLLRSLYCSLGIIGCMLILMRGMNSAYFCR